MPELEAVSVIIASSSRIKLPLTFFSDIRNELGEFITFVPTITPSSTWYSAFPVISFQPLRVLPSKSDCQPCEKIVEEIKREKNTSLVFMKIILWNQVKERNRFYKVFRYSITALRSSTESLSPK